jgi:hypothetical protein
MPIRGGRRQPRRFDFLYRRSRVHRADNIYGWPGSRLCLQVAFGSGQCRLLHSAYRIGNVCRHADTVRLRHRRRPVYGLVVLFRKRSIRLRGNKRCDADRRQGRLRIRLCVVGRFGELHCQYAGELFRAPGDLPIRCRLGEHRGVVYPEPSSRPRLYRRPGRLRIQRRELGRQRHLHPGDARRPR